MGNRRKLMNQKHCGLESWVMFTWFPGSPSLWSGSCSPCDLNSMCSSFSEWWNTWDQTLKAHWGSGCRLPKSWSCSQGQVLRILSVVVQSLSRVWLFETPWTAAHKTSLSLTISWSLLKLVSIELVMPSSHLILCGPLLHPLPSIRVFFNLYSLRGHSGHPPSSFPSIAHCSEGYPIDQARMSRGLPPLPLF